MYNIRFQIIIDREADFMSQSRSQMIEYRRRKRERERARMLRRRRARFKRIRALVLLFLIIGLGYKGYGAVSSKISERREASSNNTTVQTAKNETVNTTKANNPNEPPASVTELKEESEMPKVQRPSDNEKPVTRSEAPVMGVALDVIERDGITKVYRSPDTQSEVLLQLKDNDRIEVTEALIGGWFKVNLPEGGDGFVESVRVKVDRIPKNTYDETAAEYTMIVSQDNQKMKIYHNGEEILESTVSCGVDSEFTPRGIFVIDKGHSGEWDFANAVNEGYQYFTAFYSHGYLMHSITMDKDKKVITEEASKLGTAASHGCIRLPIPVAKYIYDNVPAKSVLIIE